VGIVPSNSHILFRRMSNVSRVTPRRLSVLYTIVVAFRLRDQGPPKSVRESVNSFGPSGIDYYLEEKEFDSISPRVYYSRVASEATQHRLSVSLFLESGAASAIGFICLGQADATSISI